MGKLMTRLNPVIMESSIFMTSSFLLLRSTISSRVISRVSMKERSSCFLFFLPPPRAKVAEDLLVATADGGIKALHAGRVAAIKATRAEIRRAREIILEDRVLTCVLRSMREVLPLSTAITTLSMCCCEHHQQHIL